MINVYLNGTFEIKDSTGAVLPLTGKKTCGLVALLILSKDQRRSRAWIQDKLWSDRGQDQGAASLRQSLAELRRVLGDDRACIVSQNGTIQLDPQKITRASEPTHGAAELCENLDIRDPEFEIWLRDQRLEAEATPAPTRLITRPKRSLPILMFGHDETDDPSIKWTLQALKSDIIRSLLEFGDVRILDLQSDPNALPKLPGAGVFVRLSAAPRDGAAAVSLRLETLAGHWTVWQSPIELLGDCREESDYWRLISLAQTCTARIQDEFERQDADQSASTFAIGLANRAIRTLYGFRRSDLIEGDKLLKAAYEIDPRGVYLSWRAFIRNTAVFEHLTDDFLEPHEGYELHANALSDDPLNSYSLVFAAQHSFVHDGDPEFGQTLCDKALDVNHGNPLGWAFKSNMFVQQNNPELAAQTAERGMQLSQGSPCQATLALNSMMAKCASEEYIAALQVGRMSQLTRSKCQAIRRFMFVIYKALDMPTDAERQLTAIRRREKSFTPEDLLRPDYPTWTMQRIRLAETLDPS